MSYQIHLLLGILQTEKPLKVLHCMFQRTVFSIIVALLSMQLVTYLQVTINWRLRFRTGEAPAGVQNVRQSYITISRQMSTKFVVNILATGVEWNYLE